MGICASSQYIRRGGIALKWPSTAKIIHSDGTLQELKHPIKAEQILSQNLGCLLCSSESMYINSHIPLIPQNEELKLGQIYFLMPLSKSHQTLSPRLVYTSNQGSCCSYSFRTINYKNLKIIKDVADLLNRSTTSFASNSISIVGKFSERQRLMPSPQFLCNTHSNLNALIVSVAISNDMEIVQTNTFFIPFSLMQKCSPLPYECRFYSSN
ncbi:hypothetical protein CFP56_032893 [Quercus suber]|uniref:Uncharacterized protein n=1 Tax=Quercus suber TaxID=58331 RepID=A0AAW0LSZ8_QUESU